LLKILQAHKEKNLAPFLLELSTVETKANVDGYDFGNPEGGYSIIETEILSKGNHIAAKECLNKHNGLFTSVAAINDLIHSVNELDELVQLLRSRYKACARLKM
jgi:hypothetical protein